MYEVATIAILITMGLALARAMKGPRVFDRILGANMFGTKTVLLIAVAGFLTDRPDFMDLALLYAMMNFIGTIAILKFARYGRLDQAHAEPVPAEQEVTG